MKDLMIDSRFNGPPTSGNGGYCSGVFASRLLAMRNEPATDTTIEVTLRNPLPLDQCLEVKSADDDDGNDSDSGINIYSDATELANVKFAPSALTPAENAIPTPPSFGQAQAAGTRFTGFSDHPFSHCFVCGPDRENHDGLRIFTGATEDAQQVAAIWDPTPLLADNMITDEEGNLRYEMIWAALDCPSYFGAYIGVKNTPALLGRQSLKLLQTPIAANQIYIVSAWPISSAGRKHLAGAALFTADGQCLAHAKTTWISIS